MGGVSIQSVFLFGDAVSCDSGASGVRRYGPFASDVGLVSEYVVVFCVCGIVSGSAVLIVYGLSYQGQIFGDTGRDILYLSGDTGVPAGLRRRPDGELL